MSRAEEFWAAIDALVNFDGNIADNDLAYLLDDRGIDIKGFAEKTMKLLEDLRTNSCG